MSKIRIQRKRKPALTIQTRQLFALGRVCTGALKMVATYGGNLEKDNYMRAQIENRRQDTRVKSERESYVVSQNQRLELLNIEKRLELEAKFGKDRVAELLGEPAKGDEFGQIAHTI
jgi:hypothetical protein